MSAIREKRKEEEEEKRSDYDNHQRVNGRKKQNNIRKSGSI